MQLQTDSEDTPARIARAVTLNILEEHDRLARATKRRVRAQKGRIYLYSEVLADDEARQLEKARQREAKAKRAEERRQAKERKAAEAQARQQAREDLARRRQTEKEEAERRRASQAETWTCKACGRRGRPHGSSRWKWCDYCEGFGICTDCDGSAAGRRLLEGHEQKEKNEGKRPVLGV